MTNRSTSTLRVGLFAIMLALFVPAIFAPAALAQNSGASAPLSSSDVSDEEVASAAEIVVAMQMQQQEMRREMQQKYGNPQEMDSTKRQQVRTEVMKKRQALMQEETEEHGLSAQRLNMIMTSARQDSTLQQRMKTAVQDLRQEKMEQQGMGGNEGGNGSAGGGSR